MADTSTTDPMHEFLVWWVSGAWTGTRSICAPDADTACAALEARPWRYGLPHEKATVLRVMRRVVIEPSEHERATLRHR